MPSPAPTAPSGRSATPAEAALGPLHEVAATLLDEHRRTLARDWPDAAGLLARLATATGSPSSPRLQALRPFSRLDPVLAQHLPTITALDAVAADRVLKAFFAMRLLASPAPAPGIHLPESVAALYPRELSRILEALRAEGSRVDLGQDRWRKNLAILEGRLIPVGAEFADVGAGLPRSLLLKGNWRQRLKTLACVLSGTRGFRPMFELHAHPDSLADFHPDGWLATYRRLAELLACNPHYKGVMAASWFRDPALVQISPRLRYLREYPERHGALMLDVGRDMAGTSGALARSPTRRQLFAEGRYVPTIYLMIWPRPALLAWAKNEGGNLA